MLSRRQFTKLALLSIFSPSILYAKSTIDSRQELSMILKNYPEFPVVNIDSIDYGIGITKNDTHLIFQRNFNIANIVNNEGIIKKAIFTNLVREKVKEINTDNLELKLETLKQLSNDSIIEELSGLIDVFKDKESEEENFTINLNKIIKNVFNTLNDKYTNPRFQARAFILKQSSPILDDYKRFIELIKEEYIRSKKEDDIRTKMEFNSMSVRALGTQYFNHETADKIYDLGTKTEKIIEPSINFLRSLRYPSEFYNVDPKNLKDLKAIIYKNPNNIYVKSELQRIGENIAKQIKSSPEYQQFKKEQREISLK